MYVEMIHFLLLQKLDWVPLKNRFRILIIVSGKCKYYYILLIENVRRCNYAIISSALANIFFTDFLTVFPWFPLDSLGYPWLLLVIYDSNIYEIVCAFVTIFPVICRNFLQSRQDKMTMW